MLKFQDIYYLILFDIHQIRIGKLNQKILIPYNTKK
jgi:hypothetical protein